MITNPTQCFTYSLDENSKILIKTYHGLLSKENILKSWSELPSDFNLNNINGLIIDYNDAIFDFPADDIKEVVELVKKNNILKKFNIATVCPQPLHNVFITLIENNLLADYQNKSTRVFTTKSAAEHFLLEYVEFFKN